MAFAGVLSGPFRLRIGLPITLLAKSMISSINLGELINLVITSER